VTTRSLGAAHLSRVGKTQEEIAAELRVSRALVGHWLTGTRVPGRERRPLLQACYSIDPEAWDAPEVATAPATAPAPLDWGDGSPRAKAERLERMVRELLDGLAADPKATPLERARVMASAAATLSLLGRLTGETQEISEHRIVRLPAWRRLVDRVLAALRPHPEALASVSEALETVTSDA
jgi:hypothetical protein